MTVEESPPETAWAPPRRRRSRVTLVVGLGLVGGGLAILGWLAWEFWGTNWISHRTQARVITTLHEDWAQGKAVTRVSVGDDQPVRALGIVPELVLEKSPLRGELRVLDVKPRLPPLRVGACIKRTKLKVPLVAAFWASLDRA